MARIVQRAETAWTPPPADPGQVDRRRWPTAVLCALALGGFVSPLVCFAGAGTAYALADQEQAILLAGLGVVHVVLSLTLLPGI